MTCLTVRWAAMDTGAENLKSIQEHMDQIAASVDSIRSSLSFSDRSSYEIKRRLQNISGDVSRQSQRLRLMSSTLLQARRRYSACESKLAGAVVPEGIKPSWGSEGVLPWNDDTVPHNDRDFDDSLKKLMVDLVGTAGGVGKTMAAWLDFLDEDKSLAEKVISGFNGQVGIAESLAEWLKEGMDEDELVDYLLGVNIKHIDDISFWDALKNQAGEYVLENSDDMTDAVRAGDKLAVGAKWFGNALTFAENALGNYEEYKSGDISGGRAVAETVTETVVDIGSDLVLTAGVTAGLSAIATTLGVTVGAPVIIGSGIVVAAKWGLDCLCESLWDKNFSEAVSDGFLNMGEALMSKAEELAVNAASGTKIVCEAVSDSVGKAVTAVTDGVSAFWQSSTDWAFG